MPIHSLMATKRVRVLLPTKLKDGGWVWLKRVTRHTYMAQTPMLDYLGTWNEYSREGAAPAEDSRPS
jgi:hypothetical protein